MVKIFRLSILCGAPWSLILAACLPEPAGLREKL
jgi:hypothetical protein